MYEFDWTSFRDAAHTLQNTLQKLVEQINEGLGQAIELIESLWDKIDKTYFTPIKKKPRPALTIGAPQEAPYTKMRRYHFRMNKRGR